MDAENHSPYRTGRRVIARLPKTFTIDDSNCTIILFIFVALRRISYYNIRCNFRIDFEKRYACSDLGAGLTFRGGQPLLVTIEPHANSGSTPIVHTGHDCFFAWKGVMRIRLRRKITSWSRAIAWFLRLICPIVGRMPVEALPGRC